MSKTRKKSAEEPSLVDRIMSEPLSSKLCRGNFRCTRCGRPALYLYQDRRRKLTAACYEHTPKKKSKDGKSQVHDLTNNVLHTGAALDVHKDLVQKVTIHKLDHNRHDRRGFIVTITPKKIPNQAMADEAAIELMQYCYMLVGHHYAIHNLGETGEQADCWINNSIREPYGIYLNHKYWGDKQIEGFIGLLQVLAKVHGWEVEDERINLLDRIAMAAAEGPEPV